MILGILLAIAAMIFIGLADFMAKLSVDMADKWTVAFIGQISGFIILLAAILILGKTEYLFSDVVFWGALIGVLGIAGLIAFYEAMKKSGISITLPVANSWGIVSALLGIFLLGENFGIIKMAAVVVIIAGMFMISFRGGKFSFDFALALAIFAMLCWGAYAFLAKTPSLLFGALLLTFWMKVFSSLISAPMALKGGLNLFKTKFSVLLLILGMGLVGSIGVLAYNLSVDYVPVSIAAPISSSAVVVGVILGMLVLGEKTSKIQKLGIVAAIAGIILISIG
jgi:drug/metabolite transporter (DMT)-like permease